MSVEAPQSSRKRAAGGLSLRFLPLSPRRKRSDHKFPDHADMQEEQSPSVVSPEIGAHLVSCRMVRVQPSVPPVSVGLLYHNSACHTSTKRKAMSPGKASPEMRWTRAIISWATILGLGGVGSVSSCWRGNWRNVGDVLPVCVLLAWEFLVGWVCLIVANNACRIC